MPPTDWESPGFSHGEEVNWEWASCWWAHMRERRLAITDRLAVRAVRTVSGELVGVAPLLLTERPAVGPFRARTLQFVGPDPNMTEMCGVLCDPRYEGEVYDALVDDMQTSTDNWSWIRWTGIPAASGTAEMLSKRGVRLSVANPAYMLSLPDTWEEFKAGRPPNVREALRKGYTALRKRNLEFGLEVARSPAEVLNVLPDFFRLHHARAELKGTLRHTDVFASRPARHFLFDLCNRLATRDVTRVFALRVGDRIVAIRLGFVLHGCLYLYYLGWDPAYRDHGVMTTALAETIKYAIEQGLSSVHLSFGRDRSKTRWRPQEMNYLNGVQLAPRQEVQFVWWISQLAHSYRGELGRRLLPEFLLRDRGR